MSATELPPGPRRPALAQTLQWVFDPERFMRKSRERYGSTFTARLGPSADVIFLCEPEDIKTVFRGTPEETNMGDINGLFRRVLGSNSLLVIDGDEHLRQRRLLLPPFHGERIAEHYGAMLEAAEEDVAGWEEGQTLTLQPHMQAMTLNVILAAVFGLGPGERRDRFRVLLARLLELNTTLATTLPQLRIELGGRSPWGKLMRCTAEVDELLYDEITRRRAQRDRTSGDVLSLLLDAQDADDGQAMTDRELRDQLLTMLVAGHETTATALAWAFERLLRNPAVLVRVTGELAQGSTTYLDATIKEVLRLRPVVPITARKITVPFEVGGRTYEPGTVLMPCIYLLHRHPDIYERPEEFLPERFIEHSPPPYSWIPFGGGVRRCLGSGFALAEMRAVMQTVLTRVQLAPEREASERVVRRAFTISPREGARVVVQQRLG
ncbi:MAG TPA: cytochrome P450 [Thermoleophilaceae bacterium]|nr:cytochrome P450 [Thermoleophilaceae bacterium]